ncbi:MAG: dUTP diphosphatase [Bacilli bacterium]
MLVRFKKLNPKASIPTYGSSYAAGCDLSACIDQAIVIPPHTTYKVPTGLAIELPEDTVGLIYARSGMATKRHLAPANKVGVIDADYRGEIIVALHNHSNDVQTVDVGERIAQLVVAPFYHVEFEEVDELNQTVRGEGGFGSTGTK